MPVGPRLRYAILERDQFRCHYCKRSDIELEVDHVLPKSLGGGDNPENLVAACRDCNIGKSSSPLGTFIKLPRPDLLTDPTNDDRTVLRLRHEASKWRRKLRDEENKSAMLSQSLKVAHKRLVECFVEMHGGNKDRIWILYDLEDLILNGQPNEQKIALIAAQTTNADVIVERLIRNSVSEESSKAEPLADSCERVMTDFGYDGKAIDRAVRSLQ